MIVDTDPSLVISDLGTYRPTDHETFEELASPVTEISSDDPFEFAKEAILDYTHHWVKWGDPFTTFIPLFTVKAGASFRSATRTAILQLLDTARIDHSRVRIERVGFLEGLLLADSDLWLMKVELLRQDNVSVPPSPPTSIQQHALNL